MHELQSTYTRVGAWNLVDLALVLKLEYRRNSNSWSVAGEARNVTTSISGNARMDRTTYNFGGSTKTYTNLTGTPQILLARFDSSVNSGVITDWAVEMHGYIKQEISGAPETAWIDNREY